MNYVMIWCRSLILSTVVLVILFFVFHSFHVLRMEILASHAIVALFLGLYNVIAHLLLIPFIYFLHKSSRLDNVYLACLAVLVIVCCIAYHLAFNVSKTVSITVCIIILSWGLVNALYLKNVILKHIINR